MYKYVYIYTHACRYVRRAVVIRAIVIKRVNITIMMSGHLPSPPSAPRRHPSNMAYRISGAT